METLGEMVWSQREGEAEGEGWRVIRAIVGVAVDALREGSRGAKVQMRRRGDEDGARRAIVSSRVQYAGGREGAAVMKLHDG